MGREKAARKAHGALKTQSFTGPGARQALGQSGKSKLHLSADEQKLADKGHILDEKGDAWWRRIGYADSREEFLKFWTALRPEFREGPCRRQMVLLVRDAKCTSICQGSL